MLRITTLAAASVLVLAAACGQQAQQAPADTPYSSTEAPASTAAAAPDNAEFVRNAATTYEFEVQAAQLAVERAQRPEVKQQAQATLNEVQAAKQELASVAPNVGVAAPTPMLSADQQKTLDDLRSAEAASFDDMYLDHVVAAYNQSVDLFEDYVGDAPESQLRSYAQTTLPKLQTRLEAVQALENAT